MRAVFTIFAWTFLVTAPRVCAQQETVLHSFNYTAADGNAPFGGLIFGANGNLYGTTAGGGAYGGVFSGGTAFELMPTAGGLWAETVLHSFNNHSTDSQGPEAGLIFDASGNLYGTTAGGGVRDNYGTVFELTPAAGGTWTEKGVYSFHGKDGAKPVASLVFDGTGNLYGTTASGGYYGFGTVFELTPTTSGSWMEKVLHSFSQNGKEGWGPSSSLILDAAGNLYGTTPVGGTNGSGTVFELKPKVSGGWGVKVLHSFGGPGDGVEPVAGLIFDAAGNLYGTTIYGVLSCCCEYYSCGTVFQLTPAADGTWTEKILHNSAVVVGDGHSPYGSLIFDGVGNLYGTTYWGGAYSNGTVFELTPTVSGTWMETVLHSFSNNGTEGYGPYGSLIFDTAGNLYGATQAGGVYGGGTIFEITP
jgi:uncharacterized repeat protein (TIGR03803 family)